MVSFSALSAAARRRALPLLARTQQRRGLALGGSSGPPPEWEGIDKVVRNYFPQDYQRALVYEIPDSFSFLLTVTWF